MNLVRTSITPPRQVKVLLALVCAGSVCLFANSAVAQLSNLTQLNFDLDGVTTNLTEWSTLELAYAGSSSVEYFNLNYNGQWVMQNVPVLSRDGLVTQTQEFS